jgi:hypothetical protein
MTGLVAGAEVFEGTAAGNPAAFARYSALEISLAPATRVWRAAK